MPLACILCLHFGVGDEIRGLSVGIVNYEVYNPEECFNESLVTASIIEEDDCKLNKISCRFIKELSDDVVLKVCQDSLRFLISSFIFFQKYYKTFNDALVVAKKVEIIGIILITSNFTENFSSGDFMKLGSSGLGSIQIHLDHTDIQLVAIFRDKFSKAYERFSEKLMIDCGKPRKSGNIPITFETDYGRFNYDMRNTLVLGFLVT